MWYACVLDIAYSFLVPSLNLPDVIMTHQQSVLGKPLLSVSQWLIHCGWPYLMHYPLFCQGFLNFSIKGSPSLNKADLLNFRCRFSLGCLFYTSHVLKFHTLCSFNVFYYLSTQKIKKKLDFCVSNLKLFLKVTRRGYCIRNIEGIPGIHSGKLNFNLLIQLIIMAVILVLFYFKSKIEHFNKSWFWLSYYWWFKIIYFNLYKRIPFQLPCGRWWQFVWLLHRLAGFFVL